MGRSEWVLIAVVLSAGLLGVTSAGTGLDAEGSNAVDSGASLPGEPVRLVSESPPDLGSAVAASTTVARQERGFLTASQQEFDRSTFRVRVASDGDARWLFRYERPIESDEDRSTFRSYAERFRTEQTDLARDFRNRSRSMTAVAAAETGRSMNAEAFQRDAGIDQTPTQEEGYVELSFRWTAFARVEGDSVVVGDVFEGGLYVGETQSLIFVAGDGVTLESVAPQGSHSGASLAESESVTWTGEQRFADRHPRAVFQRNGAGGDGGGSNDGRSMFWLLGGGVIGLLLVATVALVRYGGLPPREGADADGPAAAAQRVPPAERTDVSDADPPGAETSAVQEEPISDDSRVLELLEDGGGRMKQTAIVDATGWSKSKVSMLLSEMEEEGRIRKIQVGRENIIALDGHEPEAVGSPFDDPEDASSGT